MSLMLDRFLKSVLETKDAGKYLALGKMNHLFEHAKDDAERFAKFDDHVRKYGKIPEEETLTKLIGTLTEDGIETIHYHYEELSKRHIHRAIVKAAEVANGYLQDKDPESALMIMDQIVNKLKVDGCSQSLFDFRHVYDYVIPEMQNKLKDEHRACTTGWESIDGEHGGLRGGDLLSIIGRPAEGKSQPLTSKVLLKNGEFVNMGDLSLGDDLASVDGKESKVYGIYPQGKRVVYEITFADGRKTKADGEHLWKVGCKYWDDYRIMTTLQLIAFRKKAKRYGNTLYIRTFDGKFGINGGGRLSYLLGALLGARGFTAPTPTFSSMDEDVIERVRNCLPKNHTLIKVKDSNSGKADCFSISGFYKNLVTQYLRVLGLWGLKSENKFIPPVLLQGCRNSRIALLQGLMDTDGAVSSNRVTFSSSSLQLVKDVQTLVRSLGGKSKLQQVRKTTYKDHYSISVILDRNEIFYCERKRNKVKSYTAHDSCNLRILDIQESGKEECQCIAVTHDSRLYITDDYIVTHNTFQMLYSAMNVWKRDRKTVLVASMEMKPILLMERLAAMHTHTAYDYILQGQIPTLFSGDKNAKFKESLMELQGDDVPFYIVDGDLTATVGDIRTLAQQLKVDCVFIDGGYLVNVPGKFGKYEKVAEACRGMKQQIAQSLDIPCVVSWQFSREATKLKGDAKVGLEHIGYSDEIGQLSSIVLGLFQDDTVETKERRKIDILKGRFGETGEFYTNWDFKNMDFSECENTEHVITDVQTI